jgi:alkylhydroperoxidase family enzyme
MPRLKPLEQHEAPPEARPFYDGDVERYGVVLNNTKLYAHNVEVLKAIKGFAALFAETRAIPLGQKALIRVRVATLNGCPF